MSSYPQDRTETRFPVDGIHGSLRTPHDIRVLNLSRNGIAFETPNKLTVGEDYFLEVRYKGQEVHFAVNLRWCSVKRGTASGDSPIFRAGGRFIDVEHDGGGFWSALLAAKPDPATLRARLG